MGHVENESLYSIMIQDQRTRRTDHVFSLNSMWVPPCPFYMYSTSKLGEQLQSHDHMLNNRNPA